MIRRLSKIAKRHGMPLHIGLVYEVFIRLYKIKYFRNIVKHLIKYKVPKRVDFVVGCYNSGTTIIKNVIASHPDVCTAPIEGDHLTSAINLNEFDIAPRAMVVHLFDIENERLNCKINRKNFLSDLRPWVLNGKVFLDKSISNTVRINKLRLAFPGAKFVCVTRNIDSVARGIIKRSHPSGLLRHILGKRDYPISLLIRQWVMFYSYVLCDYSRKRDDILFVSYERFLSSPVDETKNIFSFMNLEPIALSYKDNILNVADNSLNIWQTNTKCVRYLCTHHDLVTEINDIKSRL